MRCGVNINRSRVDAQYLTWVKSVLFCVLILLCFASSLRAQIHIATIRPDRAAPGMNVALEILSSDAIRPFGDDGLNTGTLADQIILVNPLDSERVVFGVPEVSWSGRLMQLPIFVLPNAALGPVPFYIFNPRSTARSDTIVFTIDSVQHLGRITNDVTIGEGGMGLLSASNTLLVDSLIIGSPFQSKVTVHFSLLDPDTSVPGNPRLLPVVLLSKGPIRLQNAIISVDADSLNGGPGGGGGGHGFEGVGGVGFTGGGSCGNRLDTLLQNSGSASDATLAAGGGAATGVVGGGNTPEDQGGGGGTGNPFGLSGAAGARASDSRPGGYGGGSAGGETVSQSSAFGGGGGGLGTAGGGGFEIGGEGPNGGNICGGRFLIPMAGGSGGGAGNSEDLGPATMGGNGGGGGGAVEIVSFDSLIAATTTFSARGDSGTSGEEVAAGGGGGSGGAVYLASLKGVDATNSLISVAGGLPGQGALNGFAGGTGGFGRIRIDGPTNLHPRFFDPPVWANGISLAPTSAVPALGFVHLTGVAQDTINTFDSIRIFYRTRHTIWTFVDTVRSHDGTWSKWLPLPHDSLVFVTAMVRVASPLSEKYNAEPDWLMSHISIGVIHHQATPFLVTQDTLNFGTVRVSLCKTVPLIITNKGEAPLKIGAGSPADSAGFKVLSDTPVTIQPYRTDTILIEFCPTDSGVKQVRFTISSNDVTDSIKAITFIGTGQRRNDSLVIHNSAFITFPRTRIGSCDTVSVNLESAGKDTLFLNHKEWNIPPFTLQLVPPDSILAHNVVRKLQAIFCPSDTGTANRTVILDDREDSLVLSGFGVLRQVSTIATLSLPNVCIRDTIIAVDTIYNRGNDTLSFLSDSSRKTGIRTMDTLLRGGVALPILVFFKADSIGSFRDTIFFRFSDTTLSSVLTYNVVGPVLHVDSSLDFHFVCVSTTKDIPLTISNTRDTTRLSNFKISSSYFTIANSDTTILPGQRISLNVTFHSSDTLEHFDTLQFIASSHSCETIFRIPLKGAGDTGLKAEPVIFDSVFIDSCINASLFISNGCGAAVTIDSIRFHNAEFKLLATQNDTVPSGGDLTLTVRFCPTAEGPATDTIVLYPSSGQPFRTVVSGYGVAKAKPWAHFTLSDTSVPAGTLATTVIRLDSTSLKGKASVHLIMHYDPTVLSYTSSFLLSALPVSSDSIAFTGVIDTPGFVGSVTWRALVGPHNFSSISLSPGDQSLEVIATPGSVTVTDCSNLNGHLAVGGSYSLGPVTPNPAERNATVTVEIGSDGYVDASIYDMAGREVQYLIKEEKVRGSYQVTIPTEILPSGRYFIIAHSLGWNAAEPFIIGH